MLITIYNLPSSTQYTDVKALLHSVCGLREGFVLDNLVVDGINKKITVGLAEEEDGALLTRKINGYYYNGKQLYVQDVRKSKKNSEQPYQSSSKNMVDNSIPAAPPLIMTTPYYNMQAPGQYYGMPQTNYMNYASQQQPNFQMSQVQYPGQVHSQAPLGLSTEASTSGVNEPWYRNSQNNYQSYSSQSYSDNRPEKRSINDRSDDNYSAVNKKSKQDDSYYRRSSPSRERAANDRGWQASGGDNKPDRSNANDYERRNNDWNQIRGYYSQPNLATYSESHASWGGNDRGNENKKDYSNPDRQQSTRNNFGQSDSKFDRNDKTSMDYGTYRGKADNNGRQKSNNYGQSNQQFGRNNSVPVNRNQSKKEPGKGNFNTYHWPPAKFGPSWNVSGTSSDFYKAQNKSSYRNQDSRSRNNQVWDSTAYNDASRYMPPSQPQESSRSIKKLLKKKMKDSNPAVIARKLSTWCSQATAFLAKEILRNVGLENQSNDYVLRQLKAAISKKIEIISNQNIESYEHLVSLFRSKYHVQNDQKFYDAVLKDTQMKNPDGTPATSGPSKPKPSRQKDIEDDDEIAIKVSASKVKDFFLPNKKKRAKLTSKSVYAMSKASKKAANRIEKKVMKNMKSAYLIPTYPEGDKSVYVEHKQLLKEDLAGATNFILKPAMAKALEAELDDIVEIVKKATLSKNDFIYRKLQKSDVAEGFKKGLKIQLSKRLLNLGPVGLRIFGVPKLPSRSRVAEFLLPYKVISLKPSKKYAMFIAECEDYVHADKLFDLGETKIDGMTLSFKPLQLVAPQSKVRSADLVKFRKEFIKRQIDDSDIDILDRNNREPYELKLQTVEEPYIELDDEAGNDFDEDGNYDTNDICDADNSVIIQEDAQVEVCDLTEEAAPSNTQDEEVKTGPVETSAKDESNNEAKSLDKIENVNNVQLSTSVENVEANNDLKINTNVKNDVKIETDVEVDATVKNDVQVDATVKNDVQVNTNVKNDVTKVGKIVGDLNNDGDEKDETVANVDIGDIDEDDLEDY